MKKWRSVIVAGFFAVIAIGVICNLARLQLFNYKFWRALAQGQQNNVIASVGERGNIYFEGSTLPVATNRETFFVYASPAEIQDDTTTASALSPILNIDQSVILQKLDNKSNQFAVIKTDLTNGEVSAVQAQKLPGVYVSQALERYYPQNDFASNILGFVDANGNGQYGVEGYYNSLLSGNAPFGNSNGSNLTLTIDYNIQFMAEKLLDAAVKKWDAQSGQVIVEDPNTGKILAMAQSPRFNPNDFSSYAQSGDLSIFQNASTQQLFEPGSSLKPITMAAGINLNVITPQTTYVDQGFAKFGNAVITNYAHMTWGKQTMTQVLEKSINTGAVFVEEKIPHNVFLSYLSKFGLFEKTGIDLNETYSDNAVLQNGRDVNFATASFGQGIDMTPIQLVRAISAIANGGRLPTPYLNASTTPTLSAPIISQKTASEVTTMMVAVVNEGFGTTAQIPGYYVAGKTGTAQVAQNGQYLPNETIQSFIGFAPAYNPKFLILVKMNNPHSSDAEFSCGPVFRDLAQYIINYWQIPPDYQPQSK